jgi:hypothetical protein
MINDLRFLCGIIDSEGNFELNLVSWETKKGTKANIKACLRIGMAHEETILYVQKNLKRGKIYLSSYKSKKGNVDFYTLILNQQETYEILDQLKGQLITKKRDLEIMNDFYTGDKKEAFLNMKSIKRGTKHKKAMLELIV